MASTYENSLRLELIATGEAASTWGDKTNANLTAIAAAFGYATQDGFAADANATTTVADGAADPARALYFKITSSATLTATRTLTIAPNTISRVMWIENATTGSQSIAISQGSGANVTIPAGKTAVVYLDGAGAGASVVDAMASLNIDGSISAGAATFSGAAVVRSGNTLTLNRTDNAIGGAMSYVAGTGFIFNDANGDGTSFNVGAANRLRIDASGKVGINTSSPTANLSVGSTTTATGDVTLRTTKTTFSIIPSNTDAGGVELGLGWVAGGQGPMKFNVGGERMRIDGASGNVGIGTSSPTAKVNIDTAVAGDGGASSATRTLLLAQTSGTQATAGTLKIDGIIHPSVYKINIDSSTGAGAAAPLSFSTANGATETMRIDASGNVGIGVTPSYKLDVSGSPGDVVRFTGDANNSMRAYLGGGYQIFQCVNSGTTNQVGYVAGNFYVQTSGTERMRINASGHLLVGVSSQINAGFQCNQFNGSTQNGLVLKTTRAELNSTFAVFVNSAGAGCGSVIQNGTTSVNYAASSDRRLKENISDSDDSGSVIDAIQVRKFDWIGTDEHERFGFIAQELQEVVPVAVCSMGMPDEEDPMLGVDPSKLMALAIKEIQSLRARIAILEGA